MHLSLLLPLIVLIFSSPTSAIIGTREIKIDREKGVKSYMTFGFKTNGVVTKNLTLGTEFSRYKFYICKGDEVDELLGLQILSD